MHRPTLRSYTTRCENTPGSTSIAIPHFPEELEAAVRAAAFLSLIVNVEEASWLIRPLRFRGVQVKATRRGWTGYVKAVGLGGEALVHSARGSGPLEICSELLNSFTNQRVWRADSYPLKY